MTAIKRKYNSKQKIKNKLLELISELNVFTKEVEHWKMNDIRYRIEIDSTENKERRFTANLIETKSTLV